jgi:putative flippase GtrA
MRLKLPMHLLRQGAGYGLVGVLALCVDWGVFVAATKLGVATIPANLGARLVGACVAYVLNGMFTFRDADGARLGWRRFARYAVTWCVMTTISSIAMQETAQRVGLEAAWLVKPAVEVVLAGIVFLVYRHWIYR